MAGEGKDWRLAGFLPAVALVRTLGALRHGLTTNRVFGGHLADYREAIPALRLRTLTVLPSRPRVSIHAAAAAVIIAPNPEDCN